MLGTMYFSYVPFYLLAIKKKLNESEQGTVPHEFWEYHDPSSALRLVFTNIQVIDPPIVLVCPSSLTCFITDARGSFTSSPLQTQPLLKVSITSFSNVFVPSCP